MDKDAIKSVYELLDLPICTNHQEVKDCCQIKEPSAYDDDTIYYSSGS